MARCAVADGLETIVCTPHVPDATGDNTLMHTFSGRIATGVAELRRRLEQSAITLRVVAGGEVPLGTPPVQCRRFTINGGRCVLIESPHAGLPAEAPQTIFDLVVAGLVPIIAHPERNPAIIENPGRLIDLLRAGALAQITGDSLLGAFGGYAKACAEHLLKTGQVSIIASDAHSLRSRRPVLSKALAAAAHWVGWQAAARLVDQNPQAVLDGQPLPSIV